MLILRGKPGDELLIRGVPVRVVAVRHGRVVLEVPEEFEDQPVDTAGAGVVGFRQQSSLDIIVPKAH